ncbi:site-specific tyrosine recombinase XerD (plasmid) [Variovorax sp. PBS-H4]|uniref:tyrosine-type recombinase/integrase n=1 Tax=Variovorax sp. PBS-H4 TaxID=434008 RepID=UPI0013198477|nr:tyrosine-type recombinase/integrase [Variovorax sp. PBS-H4]VTU41516.1 site-specific tyrosine recombinase XerD [Variovorax sp. PBS-H4]
MSEPATEPRFVSVTEVGVLSQVEGVDAVGIGELRELVEASLASATQRAYAADWERFAVWCDGQGVDAVWASDEDLGRYVALAASEVREDGSWAVAVATLRRWVSGINQVHRAVGRELAPGRSEVVRRALAGVARTRREAPRRRKPLRLMALKKLVVTARGTAVTWQQKIRAERDCAILLVGHLGAFRESELVQLRLGDFEQVDGGLHVYVAGSKTDQLGTGRSKGLTRVAAAQGCALCAWWRWWSLVRAHDAGGRPAVLNAVEALPAADEHVCRQQVLVGEPGMPFLRVLGQAGWVTERGLSPHAVYHVVRRRAKLAGYTDQEISRLGGHSLRSGFITDAFDAGASDGEVMKQTWHRSITQVRDYQRGTPLAGNAVNRIELP